MSATVPKIALVIGVNGGPETGLAELHFAEESARQIAQLLAAPASGFTLYGGEPLLGQAVTNDAVRSAIFDARRTAGNEGLLLIYYIGHARYVEVGSNNSDVYLVTHNFRPAHARDEPTAYLSMRWLQESVLRQNQPSRLLLVLDCCFAGAVGEAAPDPLVANLRRQLEDALNIQSIGDGTSGAAMRKTLAAVSPFLPAYEANGATTYTAALQRGLSGKAAFMDGQVTWQSLHAYLQKELPGSQTGEYGFDRSAGAILAFHPDRFRLQTPNHQPWVMPFAANLDFVGRVDELEQLAIVLTGEEPANAALLPAIAGIGGIGKTQLANTFAHRYRTYFPGGVFWLSMEQSDTIEAQVASCGGQRGLQIFDERADDLTKRTTSSFGDDRGKDDSNEALERLTLSQQAAQVQAIWEGPERRLIIFDNLEDPALLERWRPRGGNCRILITTRRQSWQNDSGVRLFPLSGLLDEASQEILLGPRAADRGCTITSLLTDPREAEAVQGIMRELDGLPLALTLAGGYLATSSISLAGYLELLRDESINHQSLNDELAEGLPGKHKASISAAFGLSYERLETSEIDTLARTIWLAAAQLAPEPINEEVLLRAAELNSVDDQQRTLGEAALRRLRELGLIERNNMSYRLHRLLRAYARSVSPDQRSDWRKAARGLAQTVQRLDDENELSSSFSLFREHVRLLVESGTNERDEELATLLYVAGLVAIEEADYLTARRYFTETLVIREAVLGRQHRDTANTLQALGSVAYREDDYPAARRYLEQALAIEDTVLGRQHRNTANTLQALGSVAYHEDDCPAARRYFTEALAIREAVLGRQHRDTASILYALGSVAYCEDDCPAARRYFTEALAIREAVLGHQHRDIANTLQALGSVAYCEDDYPTARRYLEQALAIREAVLGHQHRDTANTLQALGSVVSRENDYSTARHYLEQALAIKVAVLGRQHRNTANTLQALGSVAYREDDYPTARHYLEQALAIREAVLGHQHRDTARTLQALGSVVSRENDYSTARHYLEQALAIREAVLGRQHRDTARTLQALGSVAYREDDYPTARHYLEQALAIREAVLGHQHRDTISTVNARRKLLWAALFETGLCALFTGFWLSWTLDLVVINLIVTCLILGLGAVGYHQWRFVTKLIRAFLRIQLGSILSYTVLILFDSLASGITLPRVIFATFCGGVIGLCWPWLITRPSVRTLRSYARRFWRRLRLLVRMRRQHRVPSTHVKENSNG